MIALASTATPRSDLPAAATAPRPAAPDFALLLNQPSVDPAVQAAPVDAGTGESAQPGVPAQASTAETQAAALIAQVTPTPASAAEAPVSAPSPEDNGSEQVAHGEAETSETDEAASDHTDPADAAAAPDQPASASLQPPASTPAPAPVNIAGALPTPIPPRAPKAPEPADAEDAGTRSPVTSTVAAAPPAAKPGRSTRASAERAAKPDTQVLPQVDASVTSARSEGASFAAVQASLAPDSAATGPGQVATPVAEVLITRHLDLARDNAWLDRLAQDIALSAGDASRVRFALAPEHLGRLTVDIANGTDGTAVRLTTESEQAQRILTEAQPRLVAEARAHGLRLSETSVDLDRRQESQPQHSGGGSLLSGGPGSGGQAGGDRPRTALPWAQAPRQASRSAQDNKAVARDLYA